jgi:hypothetical protein
MLKYLELKHLTRDVFLGLFGLKKRFKNVYEQKLFILGLT